MIADHHESTTTSAPFPLRVACVDMGSNAIRFLAAEFSSDSEFRVLHSDRRPVRLGHGVFLDGRLNPRAIDEAVEAMVDFRSQQRALGIDTFRAVATSAVRESRNRQVLLDRLRAQTQTELDVISGSEEAHLIHLAVARTVPLGDQQWLLVDLGGGSVEVSLVDSGGILWSESHTMGSVRLLEELSSSAHEPGRFQRLLEKYIDTLKIPSAASYKKPAGCIATGGNIEALAKLAGEPVRSQPTGPLRVLAVDKLQQAITTLAHMPFRQRVEELGLREDRADVILPAAMVYMRLARLAGVDEILVPYVGIKEGVAFDLVDQLTSAEDREARSTRQTLSGARTLGRRYMFDENHAVHVASMGLSLFDQLSELHQLGTDERKILHAAAILHDIGQYISYKGHHKHSLYLISHSELPNFTSREMDLVANVARYHRKSPPARHHTTYTRLSEPDQERVRKLASILRLADALDREHVQRVEDLRVEFDDAEVRLTLSGSSDLLLAAWSLQRKSQMFTDTFGRKVRLQTASGAEAEQAADGVG